LEGGNGGVGGVGEDEAKVSMVSSSLIGDDVGGFAFEPGLEVTKGGVVGLAFNFDDALVKSGQDGVF
jgi:hypothetical protein